MHLTTLETPCLILDKAKLQKNIRNLSARMKALGVNLRPHGKTAKNIDVITMALKGQEGGITVSTLKEAEYYFEKGITDIVYAVGIAPVKLPRIFRLMDKGAEITVLLDSAEQVRFVAEAAAEHGVTVPALIELDCDGHRSGITLEGDDLIAIGTLLHNEHGVSLKGVLTHAGESYQCRSTEAIRAMAEQERSMAVACAEALRASGLPCPVVSVGSTPTSNFAEDLTGVTEVRAGVYMFYDLVMAGLGVCKEEDIAVSVLASVIGRQKRKGWVITDAGWMAMSRDRGTATQALDQGYGRVCGVDGAPLSDLIVSGANQEHGIVSHREDREIPWASCGIGSMVRILPNHACATGAMYDRYHVVDETGEVVDTWHRVNGW